MKRIVSLSLSIFLVAITMISSFAVQYKNPFETNTLSCEKMRIPALFTLNDGSVIAVADLRWNHGTDSPQNIDTAVAVSPDGYDGWNYNVLNHFDDYPDGVSSFDSASFIDSSVVQSKKTGRIFVVTDMFPTGTGSPNAKKGTGYKLFDSKQRLVLYKGNEEYHLNDFSSGFASVSDSIGNNTKYSVDENYNLFFEDKPLYTKQAETGKKINQNVFYSQSELTVYKTSYLSLKYSDDNGKTWSAPFILNGQIKNKDDGYLVVGPGRGFVCDVKGKERIIFPVYSNKNKIERTSVIYSDDNGLTWKRGKDVKSELLAGKSSEAQIISVSEGHLKMYLRNNSNFITSSDSFDGGVTWTKAKLCEDLKGVKNCMVSFINTDKKIDEKNLVLMSEAGNANSRADGVIRAGVIENDNVSWISEYHVNKGFFAYSCLTQLSDGNFAMMYEDEAAHINYLIFTVSDSGTISEINNSNIDYEYEETFCEKIKFLFYKLIFFFRNLFK